MSDLLSAYIPCFNNARTLKKAIEGIRAQTYPVDELFVVDDCSSDGSPKVAEEMGVRVITHSRNLGRGAVRAAAMNAAKHDLVACCDATNILSPDFIERALPWLADESTAAVFGRILECRHGTAAERWRARHLFKNEVKLSFSRRAGLITYGTVIRKQLAETVGGFDPCRRHSEDSDLGERLLKAGYDVVFDPEITIKSIAENNPAQVLERYWRWCGGKDQTVSVRAYGRQVIYALKVMARADLQAGDIGSIPITMLAPHYQFWRTAITLAVSKLKASKC